MQKKVILITIDCLRSDRLEIYGCKRNIAPNLNKLSKNSIIFNTAISNGPNTPSSFYAMFTSEVPTLKGRYAPLSDRLETFIEIIKKNKIKTCGIHSNPHLGKYFNYHRGFDKFVDLMIRKEESFKRRFFKKLNFLLNKLKITIFIDKFLSSEVLNFKFKTKVNTLLKTKEFFSPYADAKAIVSEAINWLNKNYRSNFFLWLHFMDVHGPLIPTKTNFKKVAKSYNYKLNKPFLSYIKTNLDERNLSKKDLPIVSILYDAEILYCDYYIGFLFNYLKNKKIYNDTNIIITSDHGEALWEHNFTGHYPYLYDELLRVPLIIKLPLSNSLNKLINTQVELIDLAPTILDIYGIPKLKRFMGTSLIPLINGKDNFNHPEFAISATYKNKNRSFHGLIKNLDDWKLLISIRSKFWKLIFSEQRNKFELFNLKKDPKERKNIYDNKNELILTIKSKLIKKIKPFLKRRITEKEKIKESIENIEIKF